MNVINHPLCTTTIGAPSDIQNASSALPVAYHTDERGMWTTSFWKPDADDLATLIADGGIMLHVLTPDRQHPGVAMGIWPSISPVVPVRATICAEMVDSKDDGSPEDDAYKMGQFGSEHNEAERLKFERYMQGHCWGVAPFDINRLCYGDIQTRMLFAVWRDRAALARQMQ